MGFREGTSESSPESPHTHTELRGVAEFVKGRKQVPLDLCVPWSISDPYRGLDDYYCQCDFASPQHLTWGGHCSRSWVTLCWGLHNASARPEVKQVLPPELRGIGSTRESSGEKEAVNPNQAKKNHKFSDPGFSHWCQKNAETKAQKMSKPRGTGGRYNSPIFLAHNTKASEHFMALYEFSFHQWSTSAWLPQTRKAMNINRKKKKWGNHTLIQYIQEKHLIKYNIYSWLKAKLKAKNN